jgi:hypothetical protein
MVVERLVGTEEGIVDAAGGYLRAETVRRIGSDGP